MNNIGLLMQAFRNPEKFIQQAMNNNQIMQNPMARNAIEMYKNKDVNGINKMAENLCKEKGTSFEEVSKQIKSQFGIN